MYELSKRLLTIFLTAMMVFIAGLTQLQPILRISTGASQQAQMLVEEDTACCTHRVNLCQAQRQLSCKQYAAQKFDRAVLPVVLTRPELIARWFGSDYYEPDQTRGSPFQLA